MTNKQGDVFQYDNCEHTKELVKQVNVLTEL